MDMRAVRPTWLAGLGAVIVFGAVLVTGAGDALAVATAVMLVGTGVLARDLVLLAVGSVATLVTVPVVMGQWFPSTVAPVALLVGGAQAAVGPARGPDR